VLIEGDRLREQLKKGRAQRRGNSATVARSPHALALRTSGPSARLIWNSKQISVAIRPMRRMPDRPRAIDGRVPFFNGATKSGSLRRLPRSLLRRGAAGNSPCFQGCCLAEEH
jgi:hypothetical protein